MAQAGARPPMLFVDDDAPMRCDVDSDDVRRVYPDLPATVEGRLAHLRLCDDLAFSSVRDRFPELLPPVHYYPEAPSTSTDATATDDATPS
jgi:hypothetical protein